MENFKYQNKDNFGGLEGKAERQEMNIQFDPQQCGDH